MASPVLVAKDYKPEVPSDWCPGCGDYAILAAVQRQRPGGVLADALRPPDRALRLAHKIKTQRPSQMLKTIQKNVKIVECSFVK